MAITNFIPELWSAAIQLPFEKALVYGQPSVVNRKFEGQIKQMGDTVNVTSISDPTIRTYDKAADLTTEDLTDANLKLLIDQGDYFSFRVNDVDKVQAAGDFQGPATSRAGFGLKDKVDQYIASLGTVAAGSGGIIANNRLGNLTVVSGGTGKAGSGQVLADHVLIDLQEKLENQSVPSEGRYVIVPPAFVSALEKSSSFSRVDASGSSETLRNGIVGRAYGFDVLVSNNTPTVSTSYKLVTAGIPDSITFANQILETEALRSQNRFADIVRGLNVYGAKILRPEGLASAGVQFAAGTGVDTVVTAP